MGAILQRGIVHYAAVALVATAVVLIPITTGSAYYAQLVIAFGIFAILALSLDFVLGYGGLLNLGVPGLYGTAAYTSAILTTKYDFAFWQAATTAVAATAAVGLLLGFASLRTSGLYLALVTLGFMSLVSGVLNNWISMTGGEIGIAAIPAMSLFGHSFDLEQSAILAIAAAAVTFVMLRNILRSRSGRALTALRQSQVAARSLGVEVLRYNLLAFTISSAFIGVAGVLYAHTFNYLSPQTFGFALSIQIVVMVVLGGIGTLVGPVIGAAVLVLLPEYLKALDEYEAMPYGIVLLLTVLFIPLGIVGSFRKGLSRLVARAADEDRGHEPVVFERGPVAVPKLEAVTAKPGRPVLRAEGLVLRFGGVIALDDAAITVQEGSRHGLIGPNGSGKTSLLNSLSGYYTPQAGSAEFLGEQILGLPPEQVARRGLVRTFQGLQLFPESSVVENVMVGCHKNYRSGFLDAAFRLPRHHRDERQTRARALECLALVGLEHRANVEARLLSYGQQKLVDLARALAANARLLLLDEPTAGLHPDFCAQVEEVLRTINDELGITLVIVEHNLELIMSLCDHITVFDGGKAIVDGAPSAVTQDSQVLRAYFGEVAS